MSTHKLLAVGIVLMLLLPGIHAVAQTPLSDFDQALHAIPVSNSDYILSSIELGMTQDDFPAEQLMRLIERLTSRSAPAFEKEAVLLVLAHALADGLPIEGLVNKALEGIARGVSLQWIEQDLSERLILLSETRDLLYSEGVFSAPQGSPQTTPTAIPIVRFNQLLIHISETIGDFLEGGGSPFDGHIMYEEVRNRLTMLQGVTLSSEDVALILERIEPSDLTQVALAAVS
jgi:hypothetical protein